MLYILYVCILTMKIFNKNIIKSILQKQSYNNHKDMQNSNYNSNLNIFFVNKTSVSITSIFNTKSYNQYIITVK